MQFLIVLTPFFLLLLWVLAWFPASDELDRSPTNNPTVPPPCEIGTDAIEHPVQQPLASMKSEVLVNSQPPAAYLAWPIPMLVILLPIGLVASAFGSGEIPAGFLLALALNPIIWAAGYAFFQVGKLRCPHCRRGVPLGRSRDAAVGSTLACPSCRNHFIKPIA